MGVEMAGNGNSMGSWNRIGSSTNEAPEIPGRAPTTSDAPSQKRTGWGLLDVVAPSLIFTRADTERAQ